MLPEKQEKNRAMIVIALALTAKRTVLKQVQIRGAYIGAKTSRHGDLVVLIFSCFQADNFA